MKTTTNAISYDMDNNDKEALFSHLEAQNFAGPVDLIMYIEG